MALLLNGKNPAALKSSKRVSFTATSNQTTFSVSDGYSVGDVEAYLNGIRLVEGDDYIATNGSDIILTSGATAGDTLVVTTYNQFLTSSAYTKAESDNKYLPLTGGTMSSYIRTPNYGVSSYSDSASASLEASPGSGTSGVGIKVWGRSVATSGGDIHYITDNRGAAGGVHKFFSWNGTSLTEYARIDSAGRFTVTNQVVVICGAANASRTAGTYQHWGTAGYVWVNTGNAWNSSTGVFTAPVAGNYLARAAIRMSSESSVAYNYIQMTTSNNTQNGQPLRLWSPANDPGTYRPHELVYIFRLNQGDTITPKLILSNSATLDGGSTGQTDDGLSIVLLN